MITETHDAILIGHASGDVREVDVAEGEVPRHIAADAAKTLGELTDEGFRTIVAAAWRNHSTKTAGLRYVVAWQDNAVKVLLRSSAAFPSSSEFYTAWAARPDEPLRAEELFAFCDLIRV